jgi:hypothetical protein
MKSIRQKRNQFVELVRRGGKTVQQDDRRLRRVPGLAEEDPKARNLGGLELRNQIISLCMLPIPFFELMKLNRFGPCNLTESKGRFAECHRGEQNTGSLRRGPGIFNRCANRQSP